MNNWFVALIFVSAIAEICSWDIDSGVPCIPGPPGLKGSKGFKGAMGKVGIDGLPGYPGATTLLDCPIALEAHQRVARDVESCRGKPGQPGEPGEKGERGKVGVNGQPGQPGLSVCKHADTIPPNRIDKRSIELGSEPAGPPSHQVNAASPVMGPPGFPGPRGYPGPPGEQGYAGFPGRKGVPGKISS